MKGGIIHRTGESEGAVRGRSDEQEQLTSDDISFPSRPTSRDADVLQLVLEGRDLFYGGRQDVLLWDR